MHSFGGRGVHGGSMSGARPAGLISLILFRFGVRGHVALPDPTPRSFFLSPGVTAVRTPGVRQLQPH